MTLKRGEEDEESPQVRIFPLGFTDIMEISQPSGDDDGARKHKITAVALNRRASEE